MGRKRVTLCGQQFDVVEQGLAEAQVAACLTEIMAQARAASEGRDPLTELCKTCEQMDALLRDTKTVLQSAREATFKAVELEKQRLLKEAYTRAQETDAQARQQAQAIRKEAHQALTTAKGEADAIVAAANKQAGELMAISSQKASAALLEAGERIQNELVATLKAQAQEALASKLKVRPAPVAEASPAAEAAPETPAAEEEDEPQDEKEDREDVYDSRVFLLVHSPKGDGAMRSFHQQLSSLKDVKIAAERGSSESMELTIELEKPIPLREMLLGLPQVQKVTDEGPAEPHRWGPWRTPKGAMSPGSKVRVELVEASKSAQPAKTEV